jgi:hypothetical protein
MDPIPPPCEGRPINKPTVGLSGGTVPLPRWLRLPERRASRALPVGDWSLRTVYARSIGTAFYYYGTPLLHGLQVTSVLGVLAVAAVALGLGTLRFVRKDIGV